MPAPATSKYTQLGFDHQTGQHWGKTEGGSWEKLSPPEYADAIQGMRPAAPDTNTFGAGFREMSLPGDPDKPLGESLKAAGQHFFDIKKGVEEGRPESVLGPGGVMLGDVVRGGIDQARQAYGSLKSGDYGQAASHALQAAIPIVGPVAGTLGTNLGTAIDTGDYRRVGGNVAALGVQAVLPKVAGKAFSKLGEVTTPKLTPPPSALRAVEFDKAPPGGAAGVLTESSLGGTPVLRKARLEDFEAQKAATAAQNEAAYDAQLQQHKAGLQKDVQDLRGVVDRATPTVVPGVDERMAGQNLGKALDSIKSGAQDAFQNLDNETAAYAVRNADSGLLEGPVRPNRLVREARSVAKELDDRTARTWTAEDAEGNPIPEQMRSQLVQSVHGILDQISSIQNKLTVQQAMELRTSLGEQLRSVAQVLPTRIERVLTRLEGAIDGDVEGTLNRMAKDGTIDKATVDAARAARGTWAQLHSPFIKRLTQLAEDNPEAAYKEWWASRTSVDDLAQAKQLLPPEVYDTLQFHALRQKVVSPYVRNATLKPDPGSAIAGQTDTFPQVQNPQGLMDLVQSVDDPRFRAKLQFMLGPQLSQDIVSVAKQAAGRINPKLSTELPTKDMIWDPKTQGGAMGLISSLALHPFSMMAGGGAIGLLRAGVEGSKLGATGGLAAGLSAVALEYGLAKLLVNPGARAQLGRVAAGMTAGGGATASTAAIASALASKVRSYAQEYDQQTKEKQARPSAPPSRPAPPAPSGAVSQPVAPAAMTLTPPPFTGR